MTTITDIYDAVADKGILFNVSRQPLFLQNGERVIGREAIVRADSNKPIAVVSPSYRIVDNDTMLKSTLSAVEAAQLDITDAKVDVQSAYNGSRTMLSLTLPAYSLSVQEKNDTAMQIVMLNSYDATWKFIARVGGFRFKCANGQFFGKKIGGYSHFHRQDLDINQIASNLSRMIGDFNSSGEWFDAMIARKVTQDDVKSFIAAFLKIDVKDLDKSRVAKKLLTMFAAYATEMGMNAYALYNTFTDFITHKKRLERSQADSYVYEENRFSTLVEKHRLFVN